MEETPSGEPPPQLSPGSHSLEAKLRALREELSSKEDSLQMAARFGKQLLEANNELTQKLETSGAESTAKIESLEQQVYSLERRLDQRAHMEELHRDEAEGLRRQLSRTQEQEDVLEAQHQAHTAQLNRQMSSLQSELDKMQLSLNQEKQLAEGLESQLREARDQLQHKTDALNETCSDEIAQLHSQLLALQSDKIDLDQHLGKVRSCNEQLELELTSLKAKLGGHDQQLEEARCEATSYFNALQKSREEIQELKVELDLLRMEAQNHEKKGNSLFAEVEDRRVEAEKELISAKVQYESLQKQHELTRDHLHKLKLQMAGLLQMCGGRADSQHVERLEQQLSQARSQIQSLADRVHTYEQQEKREVDHLKNFKETCGEQSDKYVEYLQALIKSKDKELAKAAEECRSQRFLSLASSQKVVDTERRLYASERQKEGLQGQVLRLKLNLDELKLKYEPESMTGQTEEVRQGLLEKIPLEEDETEVSENHEPSSISGKTAAEKASKLVPGLENIYQSKDSPDVKPDQMDVKLEKVRDIMRKRALQPTKVADLALKSSKVKKVTLSDNLETHDLPETATSTADDSAEVFEGGAESTDSKETIAPRVRGRQKHQKTLKVTSSDMKDGCQQQ